MCRLRKSRDINYEKAGWISFSLALDQGPGCCQKQWNWTRVMRRPSFRKFLLNRWSDFCILSEKTPSNFRISKNRWKEKWGYLYKLQPKRDYFCTDVGHRQKCVNRPHPTRNTHSKDGDKQYKQSCTPVKAKPLRGGWISFSMALDQGPGCPCTPWLLLCSGLWRCQAGEAVYAHALLGGRDK